MSYRNVNTEAYKKVYAKKNAIWPFTVVGRPPQEDSQFGALVHEISGKAIEKEIPGLKAVNAVDESGVHPILLAVGSERYTPYNPTKKPQELLTIANHILGTGQMSLAKYVFICDEENAPNVNDEKKFFTQILIQEMLCFCKTIQILLYKKVSKFLKNN